SLLVRPAGWIRRDELRPRGGSARVRVLQHERRARLCGHSKGREGVLGRGSGTDHTEPRMRGCESTRMRVWGAERASREVLESGRARQAAIAGFALPKSC